MGGKKKRTGQTPRRKSARKRERSLKGQYYDDHFSEFSGETDLAQGSILDMTPATEVGISTGSESERTIDIEEIISSDAGETIQFLENIYCLYHSQPVLMNYILFNIIDPEVIPEEVKIGHSAVDNTVEVVVSEEERSEETSVLGKQMQGNNVPLPVPLEEYQRNKECDLLSKQLFEKSQRIKVLTDRVQQLENNNEYRKAVVRLEEILVDKDSEIKNLEETIACGTRDNITKVTWFERIVEENENEIENLKEDNVKSEAKVVELQEAVELKEREVKQLTHYAESFKSEVARLKKANVSNAAEVSRLLGTVEFKEKEIKRLEEVIKCNDGNEAEVTRLNALVDEKERDIQEKMEKINEQQGDINDCLSENARLRTKNMCLKNEKKANSDCQTQTVKNMDSEKDLGGMINQSELAETINILTDAIATMNTRLTKQEELLRTEQNIQHAPKPPPRNIPPHPQTRPLPQPRSVPQISVQSSSPIPVSQVPPPPLPPPPTLLPTDIDTVPYVLQPPQKLPPTTQASAINTHQLSKKSRLLTTMIITDSMCGKVNINNIKENIDSSKEAVIFKRFPGHTAEEMSFYAPKPLHDCQPDQVVIVAGTNDLSQAFYQNGAIDEYEVVDRILKIARAAREKGVKRIHISGVMVRKGNQYRDAIVKVNDLLYMACIAENFCFMDQKDISMSHISSDGLHLNAFGANVLKRNILSVFQTNDFDMMNFRYGYETTY